MPDNLSTLSIVLSLMAILVSATALTREPAPITATADIVGLTRNEVLGLAQSNLSESALRRRSHAYAEHLAKTLNAIAEERNLVIVPRGVGVYGAPDITPLVREKLKGGYADDTE